MANFGSGSQLLGGTDALSAAMASRGVDASILNQQSPASAGGQQPIPTPLPPQSAPPVAPNGPSNNPTMVQGPSASSSGVGINPEAEMILKALTGRLQTLSKNGL